MKSAMFMIENVLEKADKKVDAAEVFLTSSEILTVSFDAGKLKTAERKLIEGIALRVIDNGRIGFSSTTDPERVDDVIEHARAAAAFGKEACFMFPGTTEFPSVATFDPAVEICSAETMVQEGRTAVESLAESCPDGLTYATLSTAVTAVRIVNTSGLDSSFRSTSLGHSVVLNIVEGDSILWIEEGGHYGTLEFKTGEYVTSIADKYRRSKKKAPKVSGTLPAIITARQMPNIVEAVMIGVNGMNMLKGESPLIGLEGEKILGGVTLVDDPLIAGAPGSRPFDDEGMPSQKTSLFRNGVFETFLYDLYTGSATGHVSTGSASRSSISSPSVAPSNIVMSTGDSDIGEMTADMHEGIIVYDVVGGGQSNLIAGDFSVNVMLGFLVRNGNIEGRLVDTMISGNVYEAFGRIAKAGRERKQADTLFAPDIMFAGLNVSSR